MAITEDIADACVFSLQPIDSLPELLSNKFFNLSYFVQKHKALHLAFAKEIRMSE